MKSDKMLEEMTRAFADADVGGKRGDPELAALDRGILTVALMIAGLDGTILPDEFTAFVTMAKACRGASAKNTRALFDGAIVKAGQIAAMAQSGVYSEPERLAAFVRMADESLPKGFGSGSMADLRRAFALWIAMGVSDGAFSGFENRCVHALVRRFALLRAAKARKFVALIEPDFFAKAEKIFRDMAVASKRAKAEKALSELIEKVSVRAKDGMGWRRASGISLAVPMPGPTITGWK